MSFSPLRFGLVRAGSFGDLNFRNMYIDPGATSLFLQLILSGIIGMGFTLRSHLSRLYRKLRNRGNDEE